jgi:NAD(P)H-dependent FMN reductase
MQIVAFGASTSKTSINKQFATFAASQFKNSAVTILDLNDFELPLYSIDYENEKGIPDVAVQLYDRMQAADLLIISLAEHNGTYTAVFKNCMDWLSRHQSKFFMGKQLLLLSTSPGARGGKGVMDAALTRFPSHGATEIIHFSLPSFEANFSPGEGIIQEELKSAFEEKLEEMSKRF